MLVDEKYGDVFPLLREALKGRFYGGVIGLLVDDEKVLLRVWRWIDVLRSESVYVQGSIFKIYSRQHRQEVVQSQSPAVVQRISWVAEQDSREWLLPHRQLRQ